MSLVVYKQRHKHPNKPATPSFNGGHIRYIGRRSGVEKHSGEKSGLFGCIKEISQRDFLDVEDIAQQVEDESLRGRIIYRSVISFRQEDAREIGLESLSDWKRLTERKISVIRELNDIKAEDFSYVAAFHSEKGHPHLHIAFWDHSDKVRNDFTHPDKPDQIRRDLVKDLFREKLIAYGRAKDRGMKRYKELSNELVDSAHRFIERRDSPNPYENEKLSPEDLESIKHHYRVLKSALPKKGRLDYQFLPPDVKEKARNLVRVLSKSSMAVREEREIYIINSLMQKDCYGIRDEDFEKEEERLEEELDKLVANRFLKIMKEEVKSVGRAEESTADSRQSPIGAGFLSRRAEDGMGMLGFLRSLSAVSSAGSGRSRVKESLGRNRTAEEKIALRKKMKDKGIEI